MALFMDGSWMTFQRRSTSFPALIAPWYLGGNLAAWKDDMQPNPYLAPRTIRIISDLQPQHIPYGYLCR